jgi:hypothetical protein
MAFHVGVRQSLLNNQHFAVTDESFPNLQSKECQGAYLVSSKPKLLEILNDR